MTIEEFKQLKEKDKVLYQGKICTIHRVYQLVTMSGVFLKHKNKTVRPDTYYYTFWSGRPNHCLLIEQMILISRANL